MIDAHGAQESERRRRRLFQRRFARNRRQIEQLKIEFDLKVQQTNAEFALRREQ